MVELLVVVSIFTIMLAAAGGALFTTILGNDVVSSAIAVKQQGDFAISQMSAMLRNSSRVEVCDPAEGTTSIKILNRDGGSTNFKQDTFTVGTSQYQRIASEGSKLSGGATVIELTGLTDDTVQVTDISFICTNAPREGVGTVKIQFTLQNITGRKTTTKTFTTSVGLRRY